MAKGLRHIGTQGRTPLLILGYNPGRNEVVVIDLKLLRSEELTWLTEFMAQDHVYKARTLSEPLNHTNYAAGVNAFAYFLSRATQLPFYEVNVSDKEQCHEWTKTDSRVDPRLPDHPFINRVRELLAARAAGQIPPPASEIVATETETRSGSGDVMDTVRKFMQESGQAAAFIAKPDGETTASGSKSDDETANRLSALENSIDRIEKLLSKQTGAAPKLRRGGAKK